MIAALRRLPAPPASAVLLAGIIAIASGPAIGMFALVILAMVQSPATSIAIGFVAQVDAETWSGDLALVISIAHGWLLARRSA